MFIYFPEYSYNRIKKYLKFTFNTKTDKEKTKKLLLSKLNEDHYLEMLNKFASNQIKLPKIEFNFCKSFFFKEPEVNLGIISEYDKIDNRIKICHNYLDSLDQLSSIIDKEMSYALEMNLPEMQRKLTLNDYCQLCIKACKKINYKTTEAEIIKRCAYLEMKYRYKNLVQNSYEDELVDNLKINEIVRKLIDSNFNI